MATIYGSSSPCARCSVCGSQRQFHFSSSVPHSSDRDHPFVAMTIEDFDPEELDPEQLVDVINSASLRAARLTAPAHVPDADWDESGRLEARASACREELKARIRAVLRVDWDDLMGSIEG